MRICACGDARTLESEFGANVCISSISICECSGAFAIWCSISVSFTPCPTLQSEYCIDDGGAAHGISDYDMQCIEYRLIPLF